MKLCYSAFFDASSGMGEAARNIVSAFYMANTPMTTEYIPNMQTEMNLGLASDIAKSLQGKGSDYNIKIIHVTPDLVTKYLDPMRYHIFHLFWETDKLPKWWVWCLNLCDEVWTGDEYHKQVFIDSGVKKHIWVCPQPIDTSQTSALKYQIPNHQGYLFYSIFQWIERKNPKALVTAYWKEFENEKNVGLLLKTYKERFTHQEGLEIKNEIMEWKNEVKLKKYPPVYIYSMALDKKDILRVHETGDCFVLPHRGEGWGVTIAEAMLFGKPIIATKRGGITEYLSEETAYLLTPKDIDVFNMDFVPWYEKSQKWADIDENELRAKMRYCFTNQEKANEMGRMGKKFVISNFSYLTIGNKMKDRLLAIEKDYKL